MTGGYNVDSGVLLSGCTIAGLQAKMVLYIDLLFLQTQAVYNGAAGKTSTDPV